MCSEVEYAMPASDPQGFTESDNFENYKSFMAECGNMGILGLLSDPDFGGTDMGIFASGLAIEECARVCGCAYMLIFAHIALTTHVIERNGTEDQKKRFLPDLISGEKTGALAMSEPTSGSDVMSMKLVATKPAGKVKN